MYNISKSILHFCSNFYVSMMCTNTRRRTNSHKMLTGVGWATHRSDASAITFHLFVVFVVLVYFSLALFACSCVYSHISSFSRVRISVRLLRNIRSTFLYVCYVLPVHEFLSKYTPGRTAGNSLGLARIRAERRFARKK